MWSTVYLNPAFVAVSSICELHGDDYGLTSLPSKSMWRSICTEVLLLWPVLHLVFCALWGFGPGLKSSARSCCGGHTIGNFRHFEFSTWASRGFIFLMFRTLLLHKNNQVETTTEMVDYFFFWGGGGRWEIYCLIAKFEIFPQPVL